MKNNLDSRSISLRLEILRTLDASRRGHVGSSFSLVEILRVLYDDILQYKPSEPDWPYRDRFILSKGHGCLAQYVLLAEKGFFPKEQLQKFCQADGMLGGHPDHKTPGVEASTGSLGHGLSIGVGMALNARIEKQGYRTFVVLGDGESNEGSVWEAALCAGKHKLDNLVAIVDYNKMQSYGPTFEVQDLEPLASKWQSFGFGALEIDGHDVVALRSTLTHLPVETNKPSAIICHTVKGKGVHFAEGKAEWHHKSRMSDSDMQSLYEALEVTA